MSIHIAGAKIAGIPTIGTVASISGAEITQLIAACSGVIRSLVITGATGLAFAAIIASAMEGEEENRRNAANVPIGLSLVRVNTEHCYLCGVIVSESVAFECEDQSFVAPFDRVQAIYGYRATGGSLNLIDSSEYRKVSFKGGFELMTGLGLQKIILDSRFINVYGMQLKDIKLLRTRLTSALSYNWNKIIEILGSEIFKNFFNLEALDSQ